MLLWERHMCSKIGLSSPTDLNNFTIRLYRPFLLVALGTALFAVGCAPNTQVNTTNANTGAANAQPPSANTNVAQSQPATAPAANDNTPVTLPVIDAMFADESFAGDLKSKAG